MRWRFNRLMLWKPSCLLGGNQTKLTKNIPNVSTFQISRKKREFWWNQGSQLACCDGERTRAPSTPSNHSHTHTHLIHSHSSLSHSITPKHFSVSEQIDSQFGSHGKLVVQTVQRMLPEQTVDAVNSDQWRIVQEACLVKKAFFWTKHTILNVRKSVEREQKWGSGMKTKKEKSVFVFIQPKVSDWWSFIVNSSQRLD